MVCFLLPDFAFGEERMWSQVVLLLPGHWLCPRGVCRAGAEGAELGWALGLEELPGVQVA